MFATKHKKSLKPNIDSHGGAYVGLAKSLFRFFLWDVTEKLKWKVWPTNTFNVYFVRILYCASNLWQFKGHAKFAEMNAVVSTFGILWDQKVEIRGGSVMIDFLGFWIACTSLWGHPCKSFYFRLISVRWTFHQGFILLWIVQSIKD